MRRSTFRVAAALAMLAGPLHAAPSPVLPPAPAYGPDRPIALSALETRAVRLARERLGHGGARAQVSGALVLACRELAARAAAGEPDPISRDRVRGALARALAFDAAPAVVLVSAALEEAPAALVRSLPRDGATHVGAGVVERDGAAFAVLLLSERKVTLDPFPRDVAAGARAVLQGALPAGLARPRVFVTLPSGTVEEASVSGGRGFRAPIRFASPGRHLVEVVAEGEGGPEVAALLTVSAGGAPLDAPPRAAAGPDPVDVAEAEASVVRALNATRRRHGLASLRSAPEIAAVARRHSEAMAAAGRIAHLLTGSGDAGGRLRRAGIRYRRAYENVARASTALEAHAAVEESPAHLGNVLRPAASGVGVGIARARLPSGEPVVYLTEILVEPPEDVAESRLTPDARVREALWRERERLRLPPLTSDASLDALARDAVAAMRERDETDPGDVGERALGLGRKLAAVDVFVASATDEAVRSANLRDARFGRVGVGLAAGDSRRFGKGRLWIAVVYTD